MKRNIALKWAKALESGKYKQGNGFLKNANKITSDITFCCLGVLCDISKQGTWRKEPTGCFTYKSDGESKSGELPHNVQEWSGMNTKNGSYKGIDRRYSLIGWNDYSYRDAPKASFKQIAAFIRKYYKAL